MEKEDRLTYYGHCPSCNRFVAREARVIIKDIPDTCPECGSTLSFDHAEHHHRFSDGKRERDGKRRRLILRGAILAGILLLTATISASLYFRARLNRSSTADEVRSALEETAGMNVPEILSAFRAAGFNDSDLGSMFNASRYTVTRLRTNETEPTASMEAGIRGFYTDYQLLGR